MLAYSVSPLQILRRDVRSNYKWGGIMLSLLSEKKEIFIFLLFPYIRKGQAASLLFLSIQSRIWKVQEKMTVKRQGLRVSPKLFSNLARCFPVSTWTQTLKLPWTYPLSQPVTIFLTGVLDNTRQMTFSKRSKRNLLQAYVQKWRRHRTIPSPFILHSVMQ